MTDSEFTPTSPIHQQTAVEIQIGDGANARLVHVPVKDTAEALALQRRIVKHPGKLVLGEDTDAPMTINCGRVVLMTTVLLAPTVQQPPPPPKIATLRQ